MSPRILLLLVSLAPPLHAVTLVTSHNTNTSTTTSSTSGSYMQTFFSVIGVGLGNLMGLELGTEATTGQDTVVRDTGTSHTRHNTTVPRPVCAATSAECRARDRRGAEQLITCGKAAHHGRVVNGSAAAPGHRHPCC